MKDHFTECPASLDEEQIEELHGHACPDAGDEVLSHGTMEPQLVGPRGPGSMAHASAPRSLGAAPPLEL